MSVICPVDLIAFNFFAWWKQTHGVSCIPVAEKVLCQTLEVQSFFGVVKASFNRVLQFVTLVC